MNTKPCTILFTIAPLVLFAFFALTPLTHAATVRADQAFVLQWDYTNPATNRVAYYIVYEIVSGVNRLAVRTIGLEQQVPITPRPVGTHVYVATAVNDSGLESEPSQPVTVIVTPLETPPGPGVVTNLTGVRAGDNLTLTWTARPASEAVTFYTIYQSLNGVAVSSTTTSGVTLTINNLAVGLHSFQVAARNATGEGPRSTAYLVDVTPTLALPGAPVNLRKAP